MAQTAETGGDQAKCLQHLMHTEEQQLHTWQIHRINQMASTTSGLPVFSVANPDGTISHHLEKNPMESACLEEAHARFTQANNTPFLTTLLIEELSLLNCNDMHFDAIANGTYQPPDGMEPGTQQLLQHLKQPPEVPDCDLMLTETIHQDGWQKAKEQTASSLSGTHFGHYKAGTYNKLINAVHTALLVIPMKMGFSYQRWQKGINVMLKNY